MGTCIRFVLGGLTVMFLAGLPLRLFIGGGLAIAAALPIAFHHDARISKEAGPSPSST